MQYEICLEFARNLESLKKVNRPDKEQIVEKIATLLYKSGQRGRIDSEYLNSVVDMLLAGPVGEEGAKYFELTPDFLLQSEILSEELVPWANKLRKKLFKTIEAPFDSYEKAVEWMEENGFSSEKIFDEGIHEFDFDYIIDYTNLGGVESKIFTSRDTPLGKIISASQKLESVLDIGLYWESLVYYVLADIPPFVSSLTYTSTKPVRLPSGRSIVFNEVNIILRSPIGLKELLNVYQSVRQELGISKVKGFNVIHLDLYRLVRQKGGAPKGRGTVDFWKNVLNEWKRSHAENTFNHWKSIKISYDRINEKLNNIWYYKPWLHRESDYNEKLKEVKDGKNLETSSGRRP